MKHASLPVTVHLFLLKDKRVLLVKRANTGFKDQEWSVPAGRLETGESILRAAVREAKEEVNARVRIKDISVPLVMCHQDKRGERLYFFFSCSKWTNELENLEPEKCSAMKWFLINKLPSNMVLHVSVALKALLSGKTYLECGFK